jgi:dihydroflavonol-4-reductase
MRVVVTGATGHVGSNLVRALVERGDQVKVLVRARTQPLAGLEVERVVGDVRDAASLRAAFAGAEVVYHLAAVISISGDPHGRSARSTSTAPGASPRRRWRPACAGWSTAARCTPSTCTARAAAPVDETVAAGPRRPPHFAYDRSKAAGERALREVMARGLDAVILHPSGVIGPYDFGPSRMGRVFLGLYHRTLPSLIDGGFDFVDVRDVAGGLIAAASAGAGRELPRDRAPRAVGRRRWPPRRRTITGVRPPRLNAPIWAARLGVPFFAVAGRVLRKEPLYTRESLAVLQSKHKFDWAKAQRDLGYAPRPLEPTRCATRTRGSSGGDARAAARQVARAGAAPGHAPPVLPRAAGCRAGVGVGLLDVLAAAQALVGVVGAAAEHPRARPQLVVAVFILAVVGVEGVGAQVAAVADAVEVLVGLGHQAHELVELVGVAVDAGAVEGHGRAGGRCSRTGGRRRRGSCARVGAARGSDVLLVLGAVDAQRQGGVDDLAGAVLVDAGGAGVEDAAASSNRRTQHWPWLCSL